MSFPLQALHAQSHPTAERAITSYFNQRAGQQFTEPYRGIARNGDDSERVIVGQIARARSSIDVAVMGMTLPNIARAPFSKTQPDDATSSGLIARTLSAATSSIDIAAYAFTDAWIAEALRQTYTNRNITLRGVVDRSFVYNTSSATLDM